MVVCFCIWRKLNGLCIGAIQTNSRTFLQVSRTGRRLSILNINPKYVGDTDYFARLIGVYDNGGREALMYHLLHRDISKFDPFKPLYTDEMDEQKELSLDPV